MRVGSGLGIRRLGRSVAIVAAAAAIVVLGSVGVLLAASGGDPKPLGDPQASGVRLPDNRDDPTSQERADAMAIFTTDPRVLALVATQRYELLGVAASTPGKGAQASHQYLDVTVALYGINETWVGLVDLAGRKLITLDRSGANGGLSQSEESVAFAIAEADPQVAALIGALHAVRALAPHVPDGEGPGACARERCANATFSVPGGKALVVAVSLSTGQVVAIYPRR